MMSPSDLIERLERSFMQVPQRRGGAVCALILLSLIYFMPGFVGMGPMDRDEPRFAQATRQMLASGDYVSIRFMDEARNKKPIGIYWMQAASLRVAEALGVSDAEHKIWVYRIPSLIGAIAAVLFTYWAALAFVSPSGAFYAALLFASTLLIGVESRLAKTDAMLCATVALCLGVMGRAYMQRGRSIAFQSAMAFWGAIGLGVLIKGPITPMAPLFSAVVISWREKSLHWLAQLRPLRGLALSLALILPWFVMIMITTDGAFLRESLGDDMMSKVAAGQEAHGAPFGTYMLALLVTGWPMSPLFAMAVPTLWSLRSHRALLFLTAWIVPMWLVFEAVPTKLPHYVLPLYPALAIATLFCVEHGLRHFGVWQKRIGVLLFLVPIVLVLCGAIGGFYFGLVPDPIYFIALPLVFWLSVRLYKALSQGALHLIVVRAVLLAAVSYPLAYSGIVSADVFSPFRLSPRLADAAHQISAEQNQCLHFQIISSGYSEPSLALLMEPDFRFLDSAAAGNFMSHGECQMAFVTQGNRADFNAHLSTPSAVREVAHVQGININGGHKTDIAIYVRMKAAP
jgi:4-amino-4-deoxy-L-arabinose transferase-like glycosyltransferase